MTAADHRRRLPKPRQHPALLLARRVLVADELYRFDLTEPEVTAFEIVRQALYRIADAEDANREPC